MAQGSRPSYSSYNSYGSQASGEAIGALLEWAFNNPKISVPIAGLGGAAVAGIMYVNAEDVAKRPPIVQDIVGYSMQVCDNAQEHSSDYSIALKDGLTTVWSTKLQPYQPSATTAAPTPICEDGNLNKFVLHYDYNDALARYFGEYRVVGVVYTQDNGDQAIVVKPKTNKRPENSLDRIPDAPTGMDTVLTQLGGMGANTPFYTLDDGTKVSVLLQIDGERQPNGDRYTDDHEGTTWAAVDRLEEMMVDHGYSFNWPVTMGDYRHVTVSADAPKPQSF